jgi:hypothetical protein
MGLARRRAVSGKGRRRAVHVEAEAGPAVAVGGGNREKNAWRKGYWIVEAENFLDPGPRIAKVVNGVVNELPAKSINGVAQYKSGDFGFPNVHAYAYENETFGVNFGFDGFCFTREGDAIGSSGPRSAAQMFGGLAGTVAPAAAAPGAVGMPPLPPGGAVAAPVAAPLPPPAPLAPPMAPSAGMPPLPPGGAVGGAATCSRSFGEWEATFEIAVSRRSRIVAAMDRALGANETPMIGYNSLAFDNPDYVLFAR